MKLDKRTSKALSIGRQQAKETLQLRKLALQRRAQVLRKSPSARTVSIAASRMPSDPLKAALSKTNGILVAEGDSWFDYPLHDVLKALEDEHGYDVESVAHKGDYVEDMAYGASQLDDFTRRIEKVIARGHVPKAILLSGGGNDTTGDEFSVLLNHSQSSIRGLNSSVVDGVINQRIRFALITIISAVTSICEQKLGERLPIVLHGYDYPVPDGRGFLGGLWILPGPWLEPGFRLKGYRDIKERIAITAELINGFNTMLSDLVALKSFDHVHYLDLRKTLSTGANYKEYWADELHPTKRGFECVASKFAALLKRL